VQPELQASAALPIDGSVQAVSGFFSACAVFIAFASYVPNGGNGPTLLIVALALAAIAAITAVVRAVGMRHGTWSEIALSSAVLVFSTLVATAIAACALLVWL
jgi:hypothetical protein